MSDLLGGGPSTSAGNGRGGNGGSRVPPGPETSGSPGIKGPREVMRERNARVARKRAEEEARLALERRQAEEEARLAEEDRRRSAERRAAAAGAVGGQRGSGESAAQRISGGSGGQRLSDNSQRTARRYDDRTNSGERAQETLQGVGRGGRAMGGGEAPTSARPRPAQPQQQQAARPPQPEPIRTAQPEPTPAAPNATGTAAPPQSILGTSRSSFPHAFERWETLSAHWEGLTSFWIRRLEENSNEINRDPLSQQLSRQVTDLSAAGANLFHAVVELQRLRASSERKFQRWFFETRAEQERAQEIQALTEASLESERRSKEAAVAEAIANERANSTVERQLAEMKRELQISKEEARRAWEELGRREQEERERTISLRDGLPTLIGGVQVVPMMQGVPSRHESTREPLSREGPGAAVQPEGPASDPDIAYQQYSRAQQSESADPFVEIQQRVPVTREPRTPTTAPNHTSAAYSAEYTQAPAVQPTIPTTSAAQFYQQHQGVSLHPVSAPASRSEPGASYIASAPSEGAFSEEEYEIDSQGQFIRDARGNKIRYQGVVSDNDSDEYDVTAERERELANLQRYGQVSGAQYSQPPTSTAGRLQAPTSHPAVTSSGGQAGPVDYTGQAYGSGPGWEDFPRNHHPTRLSDVVEEDDERSRTSASQVSRRE